MRLAASCVIGVGWPPPLPLLPPTLLPLDPPPPALGMGVAELDQGQAQTLTRGACHFLCSPLPPPLAIQMARWPRLAPTVTGAVQIIFSEN